MRGPLIIMTLLPFALFAQWVDPHATVATRNLYENLRQTSKGNLLFGHEDALAYGLNAEGTRWINVDENRSDVKSVTGSHPAVYGWDIGRLELPDSSANIDDVDFEDMKRWIREGYERGGLITISWHSNNPATGGDTWDTSERPVGKIIPGGTLHEAYKIWLDRIADFFLDLKDSQGAFIPVVFRPYHEHTGSWFWWGRSHCTAEEYVTLWRFTVDYLMNERDIHHLLYAYAPSNHGVSDESDYLRRYPGDDYVDVLGTDDYGNVSSDGQKNAFLRNIRIAVDLAEERNKVAALTETGLERIPDQDWFSHRIVDPIINDPVARKLSWFLVWRNGRPDHYYAPYPGHQTADDLVRIYAHSFVLFEDELPDLYAPNSVTILQELPDLTLETNAEIVLALNDYFDYTGGSYDVIYPENPAALAIDLIHDDQLKIVAGPVEGKAMIGVRATADDGTWLELVFKLTIEAAEIVMNVDPSDQLYFYPNPAKERVTFSPSVTFMGLKNAKGTDQNIMFDLESATMDLSTLVPGVYFVKLHHAGHIEYRKLIKR